MDDAEGQARALGKEHHAAGTAPFGPAQYVYWDAGSGLLLTALGITTATTPANFAARLRLLAAYCDALTPGWAL